MVRRIFIFYDGTWCGDTAGTYTNIKRLADTVAGRVLEGEAEIENKVDTANGPLIYYRGVGLNEESIINYLVNGAISLEVKEDCIKAYKFIVDHYQLNDEIWMFGLSRGAYIVRSVAGLINNCGILNKEKLPKKNVQRPLEENAQKSLEKLLEEKTQKICEDFYEYYKSRDEDYEPDKMRVQLKNICHITTKPPIKFMGLIDTVGALGIPKIDPERGVVYEFYDQKSHRK